MALHLVRRFFGFLTAAPLSPIEQDEIHAALPSRLARLFFSQRTEDQRHAFDVRSRVGDDPALVQAALLHDVGKIDSDLGAVGRSLATIWSATSLPIWGRWRAYLDHGRLGADVLEAHGADELAVAFTRHHPGAVPKSFDAVGWKRLSSADDA
ncbi:MAG: hypothetical protein BMS9Abin17_0927 [Acidimicrobiia bacterium]|nr:MAG: hypothetical protein BMS9Abin17_0927 [Acidimicrobiia bacterium]